MTSCLLRSFVLAVAIALVLPAVASPAQQSDSRTTSRCTAVSASGTVYFVMCIDTECWYLWPDRYSQSLGTGDFVTGGKIDQIISPSFRSPYRDSFGGTLRLSWFLATHEAYFHSEPPQPGIVFEAMMPYRTEADSLGDCFGWHYHHADWVDYDGDGKTYWNELLTFDGTLYTDGSDRGLADKMLAMQMLEEDFYPSVYRAGWLWEDTDLSNWLEGVVPFDFSSLAPFAVSPHSADQYSNIYDWSRAPSDWSPYHPAPDDYQTPGNMHRMIFRSYPGFQGLDSAFARAETGVDVIATLYTHSFSDIGQFHMGKYIYSAAARHPGVAFKYVNALEAARLAIGSADTLAPSVAMARHWDTFELTSSERLFAAPIGAVLTADGRYLTVSGRPGADSLGWVFALDSVEWESFRAGGVDLSGNTFLTPIEKPLDSGSVSGVIRLGASPARGIYIELCDRDGSVLDTTRTDERGVFSFGGMTNGDYRLCVPNPTGTTEHVADEPVAVHGDHRELTVTLGALPAVSLDQNHPNPFNSATTISFFLASGSEVQLEVFNTLGRQVATLCTAYQPAGVHTVSWDGDALSGGRLSSGVYLLRLSAAGQAMTRKMVLLK